MTMQSLEESRKEIIERVVAYVLEKIPADQSPLLEEFIRQYYWTVSPEDLMSRGIMDLYGAVVSHWHLIYQREPGQYKVRAYNPQFEKHGWQSAHTVIEIIYDDMPFLVDSIAMELNRMELNIHLIIHMGNLKVKRDNLGRALDILPQNSPDEDYVSEAPIYIEIDRQTEPAILEKIVQHIEKVLSDVQRAVSDWHVMCQKAIEIINQLREAPVPCVLDELEESLAFLEWLVDDHFTFTGYQEYALVGEGEAQIFQPVPKTGLGLFRETGKTRVKSRKIAYFPEAAQRLIFSEHPLMLGKTNTRSTIHRPVYADFVSIKIFDQNNQVIGERRFIGLYTSVAYNTSPRQIPLLRRKLAYVLAAAGFGPSTHDAKALTNILETLPRDDLFHASESDLYQLAIGILYLQERLRIRLFIRRDTFGRFFSCLVYVPREQFNSELREKFQKILTQVLQGVEVAFSTRFSESVLARIHFVIRVLPRALIEYDVSELEKRLIEAAKTWKDDLQMALIEHVGEERGGDLFKQYGAGFPAGYQEAFEAPMAVIDIGYMEKLSETTRMTMSLYRPVEEPEDSVRFKLFYSGATIPLSEVVPMLENMGLRILSERPYIVTRKNQEPIWVNDYRMVHPKGEKLDIDAVKEIFQETFYRVWDGFIENDGFNRLVLAAHLNWQEITVFRAYAKYLWQTGFLFSQNSLEETLYLNAGVTQLLIALFKARFDPKAAESEKEQLERRTLIEAALEGVSNLNEDRILRRYLDIIFATIRTNYFQWDKQEEPKPYIALKLESAKIPELPLPHPLYSIFVYSPRVEAVHLRAAKVARGGIRWSDRREDFRTEVLGLMKAQQVKNAVIVPMGAKGGFVVKQQTPEFTREQLMEEVILCYKIFIHGMLDLTDNLQDNEIIVPPQLKRYDEDDPYLVVAADKGTATFSDIANELSKEYHFWLGDAFASGGSTGYDHKKMGITARGAWESVKRHFAELGVDSQTTDFTVMGIGDMSGDVFGNGMLLSRHIRLVAAFNHQHIFIDPTPDAENSYLERQRLFNLPRSAWSDYDPQWISPGGGVYSRALKSITLSPEARVALGVDKEKWVPNELIRALLKSPVDLLWNGGIGTYVKASQETHAEVGDRSNDAVRIDADELRCKVVCEGGNLGFTQLARIQFAKLGGLINTDAIDNSAGVNCSDNEVNIKILLNDVVTLGDMTEKQRNHLLVEMQEEVAELVLTNNRQQTEAISIGISQAAENVDMHARLIQEMERSGDLDRTIEFLPSNEEIANRKVQNLGLTRPEIAVLMAYAKNGLKKALLNSDLPEDPFVRYALVKAFPSQIQARYESYLDRHRLKREIICTQISNQLINEMGISFISRLQDETGAAAADIVRAYIIARSVFSMYRIREAIRALDQVIDTKVQLMMVQELNRLVRRGTRWFIRNRKANLNIRETVEHFKPLIENISQILPNYLKGVTKESMEAMWETLTQAGVPQDSPLLHDISILGALFSALDIVETAINYRLDIPLVTAVYFAIGARLQLSWFRDQIKNRAVSNHWEALARAAFRDDVDRQQSLISLSVIKLDNGQNLEVCSIEKSLERWLKKFRRLVKRWQYLVNELKTVSNPDFTMFSLLLRELLDMGHATLHVSAAKKDDRFSHLAK